MSAYYDIEKTCSLFDGDALEFLLEIIAKSSPDYFDEDDLEMASEIEEWTRKWCPSEGDEAYDTIEYIGSSHRK